MKECPAFKTLPLYPDGFPPEVIETFKVKTLSYGQSFPQEILR